MRLSPAPDTPEVPGQFWKDFIRDTAPVFRSSTQEQLAGSSCPPGRRSSTAHATSTSGSPRSLTSSQPDAIVEDNVCSFPAIPASGRPWVRIVSCNPLEVKDPDLPPTFSGLATGGPHGLGGVPRRVRRAGRRPAGRVLGVLRRARRATPAGDGDDPRVAVAEPLPLSPGAGLPPRREPRAHLAQPADVRARHRRSVEPARGGGRGRGPPSDLPQPRLAGLGRRRAHAAPRRAAGRHARTATSSAAGRATTSTRWPTT